MSDDSHTDQGASDGLSETPDPTNSKSLPLSHVHKFDTPTTTKVLLHSYRSEDGETKAVETVGYDILRQLKCACGKAETIDLERTTV